jgi:AcrR family transcriptional regulator
MRAVVQCVSEEGFERTTMRKIAERAGVSTGMLSYYFRNKRELVNAAMLETFGNSASRIDETTSSTFGPRRLETLLKQWFLSTEPELPSRDFLLRVRAAALSEPEIREQLGASRAASRSKLERSIRAGIESAHYRSDLDAALAADLVYGLMIGWRTILDVEPEHGLRVARLALRLFREQSRYGRPVKEQRQQTSESHSEEDSTLDRVEAALLDDDHLSQKSARELLEVFQRMYRLVAESSV